MNAAVRLEPAASAEAVTVTDGRTSAPAVGLDSIEDAVRAMAAGRPVLVVDNEDRENEGDIIFAAQHATPALMGWTIRYSSGVICVPLTGDRADALALPPVAGVTVVTPKAPPKPGAATPPSLRFTWQRVAPAPTRH